MGRNARRKRRKGGSSSQVLKILTIFKLLQGLGRTKDGLEVARIHTAGWLGRVYIRKRKEDRKRKGVGVGSGAGYGRLCLWLWLW